MEDDWRMNNNNNKKIVEEWTTENELGVHGVLASYMFDNTIVNLKREMMKNREKTKTGYSIQIINMYNYVNSVRVFLVMHVMSCTDDTQSHHLIYLTKRIYRDVIEHTHKHTHTSTNKAQ